MSTPTSDIRRFDAIVVGGAPSAHVARERPTRTRRCSCWRRAAGSLTYEGYRSYVTNFHTQVAKDTNSPYPANCAPCTRIDLTQIDPARRT
jgi:hypothetical protein